MKKITIAVVDDHKMIRQLWATLFAGNTEFELTGESGKLEEAIEMIKIKRPDIVFLDINLGLESGIDAMPLILESSPGTRIIVISMHNQPSYAKKMLRLGAKAYVTKNSSKEEIFKAIKEVMNGGVYICSEIKDVLADMVMNNAPTSPGLNNLSSREIGIIKLIKQGLSSKEIASQLSITVGTVGVHRCHILKKLRLENNAELIHFINNTDVTFL